MIICPQPGGGISNAITSFNSIHGLITVSWAYDHASGNYWLSLTNPANTTATVFIPSTNNLAAITENALVWGLAATNAPGVLRYYTTNAPNFRSYGATVFELTSGVYDFNVTNVFWW